MQLVDGLAQFATDVEVLIVRELFAFVFSEVKSVERVLQCERMRDLKLLPSNDSARADFVWLHLEATVFVAEQMGLLGENPRQDPHYGPR